MPLSLNFPQLNFVKPSSGFHPVTWECVTFIHFVSISCFTMSSIDELALKKHCVDVPKYSIDVSMDFFPRLFNFVVISN